MREAAAEARREARRQGRPGARRGFGCEKRSVYEASGRHRGDIASHRGGIKRNLRVSLSRHRRCRRRRGRRGSRGRRGGGDGLADGLELRDGDGAGLLPVQGAEDVVDDVSLLHYAIVAAAPLESCGLGTAAVMSDDDS